MRLIARLCGIAALLLASQGCQTDSQLLSQPNIEEVERQTLNAAEEPATKQAEITEPGRIKATTMGWKCEIDDSEQPKLIDPIENAAQLKQVWAVCHPRKPAPDVDFDRCRIYLCTWDTGNKNGHGCSFYWEADGSIRQETLSTAMASGPPTDKPEVEFYVVYVK